MIVLMSRQAGGGCFWFSSPWIIPLALHLKAALNVSPMGRTYPWSLLGGAGGFRKELCCDTLARLIMVKSIFWDCFILCSRDSSMRCSQLWNSAHSAASFLHSSKHFLQHWLLLLQQNPDPKILSDQGKQGFDSLGWTDFLQRTH